MGHFLRLLLIVIIVWLAALLIRRALQARRQDGRATSGRSATRMLPCTRCGLHIPENQALFQAGKAYCSKEHLPDH